MNKQSKVMRPPDPTPRAVLDLEEAQKELKAAYEALEVARSYIGGQALDGQRFGPRKTLEVVNAALANAKENRPSKLMQTGAVAIPQEERKRRLGLQRKQLSSTNPAP